MFAADKYVWWLAGMCSIEKTEQNRHKHKGQRSYYNTRDIIL